LGFSGEHSGLGGFIDGGESRKRHEPLILSIIGRFDQLARCTEQELKAPRFGI
jgi:hypothetical protein